MAAVGGVSRTIDFAWRMITLLAAVPLLACGSRAFLRIQEATMSIEPLADVRDMYMAHTMFRREIGLAPALIRDVADGDFERAAIVAEHLDIVETILDHHHRCEDGHLWERLIDRAGPDVEEERAIPLIEKHITAAEWGAMIADGGVGLSPEQMTLTFGLMTYEGDPDTVRDVIATMPPEIASAIGDLAGQAFARHALRVYGTATPERLGATRNGGSAR
jgi:hypothetical protein